MASNAVALSADTTGNYVLDVADGTGIDGTAAAEGATYTPTLDLTEINSTTIGSGTFTTLTFDAGVTDPVITTSSGDLAISPQLTVGVGGADGILRIYSEEGVTDFTTAFQPGVQGANITYTLPPNDGTASQFLQSDGAGVLIWATPAGSGDITDVGPGYATGAAFTDTVVSTGTTMLVWEGTTSDAFEVTIISPSADPLADVNITFPAATGTLIGSGDTGTVNATILASSSVVFGAEVANLSGDVTTSGSSAATIAADSVALTTDTTGNYVASVSTSGSIPLTGGSAGSEGAALSLDWDYTSTLGGNPSLAASEITSASTGLIAEGLTADTIETLLTFTDPTSSDKTITFPDATGTVAVAITSPLALSAAGNVSITADGINGTELVDSLTIDGASLRLGDTTNYTQFSTAGLITYVGTAVPTRTIVLTPGGSQATTTPAALTVVDGTNVDYQVADYDAATDEYREWTFMLPDSYNAGTITPTIRWHGAATSGDVIWAFQAACVTDADAVDVALSTAGTVTDTAKGTANQLNDAAVAAHTPAGTCAAGDLIHVAVYRDANAAGDTMTGDARLVHVKLEYVANAESD